MKVPASRRGVLLGLAALPAAGGIAAAPDDPHVALAEQALALWRHHKTTEWGWTQLTTSPEAQAANAAHEALTLHCLAAGEMAPPTTLPGLRALALILALCNEENWSEGEDRFEGVLHRFIMAVLVITGAELPEGFAGLVHRREDQDAGGDA